MIIHDYIRLYETLVIILLYEYETYFRGLCLSTRHDVQKKGKCDEI